MAAGTPVLVSDTGGMAEIVQHGINGLKVYAGMVSSIRDQIFYALHNEESLREMAEAAKWIIEQRYDWRNLAESTRAVYDSLSLNRTVSTT